MMNTPRKKWTTAEDNLIRKLYPESSCRAVADVLGCNTRQVYFRAKHLHVHSYVPAALVSSTGFINLKHQDNIVRSLRIDCATDVTAAVGAWFKEIRPALKRREKISLEIEID